LAVGCWLLAVGFRLSTFNFQLLAFDFWLLMAVSLNYYFFFSRFWLLALGFLLYTGFIHLLNALTLSLNAFTTLGFGDIPPHGAARYVTIVQGFIGWFLLTIFSVSLINQVLG
jgi:hypothetical protein